MIAFCRAVFAAPHRFLLGALLLVSSLAMLSQTSLAKPDEPQGPAIDGSEVSVADISNSYLRVDVDDDGQFVISSTGGNPEIADDDNKSLTYIYFPTTGANIWSSESWVRIVDGQHSSTLSLAGRVPSFGPIVDNGKLSTTWVISDVQIRQTLSFMNNPFSGRDDLVRMDYETRNLGTSTRGIGMRTMLDVLVGSNDSAPYFVGSAGRYTSTQRFAEADTMPSYFLSFESKTFAQGSLKAMGLLSGFGMTRPDVFSFGSLSGIRTRQGEAPEFMVNEPNGDSGYGLVWAPRFLSPKTNANFSTAYGLAGSGGGGSWLVSPAKILPGSLFEFEIQAWINNDTDERYTGGNATLTLPDGLELLAGESQTKPIVEILPNDSVQLTWHVRLRDPERVSAYGYSVQTSFNNTIVNYNASGTTVVGTLEKRVLLPFLNR